MMSFGCGSAMLWPLWLSFAVYMPAWARYNFCDASHARHRKKCPWSLNPNLSDEHCPTAVGWGASSLQGAVIVGPALGGVIYALSRSPLPVYAASLAAALIAALAMLTIKPRREVRPHQQVSLSTVLAGFRYVWE